MIDTSSKSIELENKHHLQLYKRYPISLVKGSGVKVYDDTGKEYIDALAGIAVNSLGHSHPEIVETIKSQSEKLIHISNLYYNEVQSKLAEKFTKESGLDRVFFCNSGAEAVEGAVKLARKFAWKQDHETGKILAMSNCFHGRTIATLALGKDKYKEGFTPMPEGFGQIEFNNISDALEKITEDTIAVILEPIQGEGGIIPATPEFIQTVNSKCKETNTLLIFDEIQAGIGRTGKMFSYQNYQVDPDIITSAKALGSGFPIGAVAAKQKVADALNFGDHGTTFGGNPLGSSIALKTMEIISKPEFLEEVREKGNYFLNKWQDRIGKVPGLKEVRGKGLMMGLQLDADTDGKKAVVKMMEKGVLGNATANNTLRLVPPLIISREELDKLSDIIEETLKEMHHV